jgi:DNA-directed RNA polymerase specialized sigma24 family protein
MKEPIPSLYIPPSLERPAAAALLLSELAARSLIDAVRDYRRTRRPRRGDTLTPGPETPLWNELRQAVRGQITRYGDKARLGRVLGLPRQRVHDFLTQSRYLPDAERTLLLLVWLQARRQGRDLL